MSLRGRSRASWALSLLPVLASAADAELLRNLKVSGQLDLQCTAARNVHDLSTYESVSPAPTDDNNDRIGDAQTRLLLSLEWDLLDDAHSRVTLRKNDRTWGTSGGGTNTNANSQPLAASGADVLGSVFVDEALFKVDKVAGQVDLTLGRQFVGEPGDIVAYFGPSEKAEYGLPVTSLDAARADWGSESFGLTGLAGKITGHAVGVAPAAVHSVGDQDVRALIATARAGDAWTGSLYVWNRVTHGTAESGKPPEHNDQGGANDNLFVVGLKQRLSLGGFWLKGEFDQDFGDQRLASGDFAISGSSHYEGWAWRANAGYALETESSGSLSAWGEFAEGSGRHEIGSNKADEFFSIRSDYRPGSIYGRFATNPAFNGSIGGFFRAGLNNRQIWGAGLRGRPPVVDKLEVSASYWDFRFHRGQWLSNDDTAHFGFVNFFLNEPGTANAAGNRHLGSEIDLDLVWTHSENVAFAAGWASFQPGGAIYRLVESVTPGGYGVNPVMLTYFDARVRF
jgi:hypothetical protein